MKYTREQRQVRILSYLMWTHASWRSPTIREIGKYMDWASSSTTHAHLTQMLGAGLIDHVQDAPRTYRVTTAGQEYLQKHGGMKIDNQVS